MSAHNEGIRIFLVVIDNSPEMNAALDYACQRATVNDGRVAVLYALETNEISPWRAVEQSLDADREREAKKELRQIEERIVAQTGRDPILLIRHGSRQETLLKVLEQEPNISLLVLGAGSTKDGPGPLINYLTSVKGLQQLKIPFVVVPPGYSSASRLDN